VIFSLLWPVHPAKPVEAIANIKNAAMAFRVVFFISSSVQE
jgi:hypothetical protein